MPNATTPGNVMAIWTTRSDAWDRSSSGSDRWDRPSPDSNAWDRPAVGYAEPSRWRAGLARTIGILGILGTVALAAYAFAPRSQAIALKFDAYADRIALPWDPKLAPGPEPIPLDRGAGSRAADASVSGDASAGPALDASSIGVVPDPNRPATDATSGTAALEAAPAVQPGSEPAPPEVESPVAPPPSPEASVGSSSEPSVNPSSEAKREISHASSVAPDRPVRTPVQSARSEERFEEPGFTAEEIQRRKDRYEAWLKEQGLERIQ
jgi:hypothetical protein